jgi:hypothetical protein
MGFGWEKYFGARFSVPVVSVAIGMSVGGREGMSGRLGVGGGGEQVIGSGGVKLGNRDRSGGDG